MFNSNCGTLPVSIPLGLNNGGSFGNGNGFDDIIALAIIAMIFGWNGNGGVFGGGNGGASAGYVLQNDFATIQRQLSDGFNSIDNALDAQNTGICNLGYTALQLNNQLATQIADCCCKTQSGIERINTSNAMNTASIQNSIKDCCCENQMIAMQNKYDAAQANCATLTAIDKLGDRIIGYMDNAKTSELRDELQAYKWQASQDRQNLFIQNLVKPQINPCYLTQNPYCSCGNANPYPYGYYGTTIA